MRVVHLFHTCLVNDFFPAVGFAVAHVLERIGFSVDVPRRQTCCGQPAFNAGFRDAARVAARHTIDVLESTTGPVVIPSGSCGDMVMHQYAGLFDGDDAWRARAEAVAGRCHEFSAFVAAHAPGPLGTLATSVAYHPSCHLARGLGIDREPRTLLDRVAGLEQRPLANDDECCGFGGVFAVKHADISARMLERKITAIAASGAERLVSCDMGCLLQLSGGLHRHGMATTTQHLAELLDEAMT